MNDLIFGECKCGFLMRPYCINDCELIRGWCENTNVCKISHYDIYKKLSESEPDLNSLIGVVYLV